MTKQVQQILMAHKEDALARAFQFGKTSIAEELAFLSEAGTPICRTPSVPVTWSQH